MFWVPSHGRHMDPMRREIQTNPRWVTEDTSDEEKTHDDDMDEASRGHHRQMTETEQRKEGVMVASGSWCCGK